MMNELDADWNLMTLPTSLQNERGLKVTDSYILSMKLHQLIR